MGFRVIFENFMDGGDKKWKAWQYHIIDARNWMEQKTMEKDANGKWN